MGKRMKQPERRNPIAEAHNLRGPAGSGYHGGDATRKERHACKVQTRKLLDDLDVPDVEEECS